MLRGLEYLRERRRRWRYEHTSRRIKVVLGIVRKTSGNRDKPVLRQVTKAVMARVEHTQHKRDGMAAQLPPKLTALPL